jgi:hypothetical protein
MMVCVRSPSRRQHRRNKRRDFAPHPSATHLLCTDSDRFISGVAATPGGTRGNLPTDPGDRVRDIGPTALHGRQVGKEPTLLCKASVPRSGNKHVASVRCNFPTQVFFITVPNYPDSNKISVGNCFCCQHQT